ncbi:hypothetical protein DIZ27_23255 [Streptomyces sp. NWU339]|uniref:hypothetical protein n=1 Tax=Streptomyces sp. NWU339 TaxID=2185284 RepID=UPI000D67743A|nr:hypothetical protein [Streptomyces sp. NWU339]PWI08359.1 hypothetical protein DIZ27_23255 [Streptomyces sp. NWU339]
MSARTVLLVVAEHAQDADDCRQLLSMLGLTPSAPKRKPGRPPVDHGHGHYSTYRKGCRCDDCREAHRQRCSEWRESKKQDPTAADWAGHGKTSTYKNHGCRCAPCRRANTEYWRVYRAQRRERRVLVETGGAR